VGEGGVPPFGEGDLAEVKIPPNVGGGKRGTIFRWGTYILQERKKVSLYLSWRKEGRKKKKERTSHVLMGGGKPTLSSMKKRGKEKKETKVAGRFPSGVEKGEEKGGGARGICYFFEKRDCIIIFGKKKKDGRKIPLRKVIKGGGKKGGSLLGELTRLSKRG